MTECEKRLEEANAVFQRRYEILKTVGVLIHDVNPVNRGQVKELLDELNNTRVSLPYLYHK